MNCQTCQTELEDFLYGELEAGRQALLNEHLSVCADCRAVQTALEHENELFAQFYEQNAIEPPDQMWQAIHDRIKPTTASESSPVGWADRFRHWLTPVFAPALLRQTGFAALLILVSVGLTTLYFATRKGENNQIAGTSPTPIPSTSATLLPKEVTAPPTRQTTPVPSVKETGKTPLTLAKAAKTEAKPVAAKLTEDELLSQQIAKATREYQSAIHLLERTIAKRKTSLDEGTIKQFESSLAMIDASIAASRTALRTHPNDPTAARFLLAAYSKKVEMMQEIALR